MSEATETLPKVKNSKRQVSGLAFLIQVSRPGLWSTTAMFYLMPLGHTGLLHSGRLWLGLFFVLFPLGLVLYGANDIVDAEGDLLNPRKGTFLFGSRGAREQLAALKWQIALVQIPFFCRFLLSRWTTHFVVVRDAAVRRRSLQRAAFRMERASSLRRADSSELSARFRLQQLVEQVAAAPVANFRIWRTVCDALACLR
jgi:hypothetical protein